MLKDYISRNKTSANILIIIAVTITIIFIMFLFKEDATKNNSKKEFVSVSAMVLKKTQNTPKINLFCTIVNPYITKLKSPVETYVDDVLIHPTEYIQKDKVLIKLNLEELNNDINLQNNKINSLKKQIDLLKKNYEFDLQLLKSEKNKLEIAKKNLNRFTQLEQKLAVSKKQVDDAKFDLETSLLGVINRQKEIDIYPIKKAELNHQLDQVKNQLDNLQLDLKRSTIISPINGYITVVNAAKGSKVEPGQVLVELHDNSKTEIRCQIPEIYVSQLFKANKNNNLTKGFTNIYDERYELKMFNISSITRINQGGADATFVFENKTPPLAIIGKTVKVQVSMPAIKDSFLIPLSSIYNDHYVYKIIKKNQNNLLKSVKIKIIGIDYKSDKEFLVVKSNELSENDKILTSTLATASDGLPVKITDQNMIKK